MNEIEQIVEKMTRFKAIESVVRTAQDSELDAAFFKHVGPFLKKIADKQNLTEGQALMFCLMINFCDSSHIRLDLGPWLVHGSCCCALKWGGFIM